MKLLTIEQLLQLHVLLVEQFGGSQGVRDLGRLEAAIATQTQIVFGSELYESPFEKAAAIIRGIIADHPFFDGNKRTGILAGLTLLELNGYVFDTKKGELEDFTVQIATDHLDISAIAQWFEKRTK